MPRVPKIGPNGLNALDVDDAVEEQTFNNREGSLVVCHRKIREEKHKRNEDREKEK